MRKFRKDRFRRDLGRLASSVSTKVTKDLIWISHPLMDAIREIVAEVSKPRTNWGLVAALTSVKSLVCDFSFCDAGSDPFWEQSPIGRDGESVYGMMDALHFETAMKCDEIPSGMSIFWTDEEGSLIQAYGMMGTKVFPTSPTLELIATERERIFRECEEWARLRENSRSSMEKVF